MFITITYTLSDDALNREFIATGKRLARQRTVKLDTETLDAEQRAILVNIETAKLTNVFRGIELVSLSVRPIDSLFNAGGLKTLANLFDKEPTTHEIFTHLERMLGEYARCQAELPAIKAEVEKQRADKRAKELAWRAEQEAKRQAQAEAAAEARLQSQIIPWREDNSAICDLYLAVWNCADLNFDDRFNNWIKEVESVDKSKDNSYCFVGPFLREGTVEIKDGHKRRVYLVASTSGSRRRQVTTYAVVEMVNGTLIKTDIGTNSALPGWSLRIRDQVAALLA